MRLTSPFRALALLLALAACADPLAETPRLGDVAVAGNARQADALPTPEAEGTSIAETAAQTPAPNTDDAPRGGLLGFFRRQADDAKAETAPEPTSTDTATLAPNPAVSDVAVASANAPAETEADRTTGGGGLFGGLLGGGGGSGTSGSSKGPAPGAPDYQQVGPGVTLPYGQIARLCGAPVRSFGTQSMRYPERGRGGYVLYDTAPGGTTLRSFFLTGFDDGCARQFTAALVIFGGVETYEQIRYGPAGASQPVSETDVAYETLKSRICRVRKGQPCGARIDRLASNTVFVSMYERFGSSPRWKNLLVHDGEVMALDIKSK